MSSAMYETALPLRLTLDDSLLNTNSIQFNGNEDQNNSYLICYLINKLSDELFDENGYTIGCIINKMMANEDLNALFISIKLLENHSIGHQLNDSIQLIVNQQFLTHYNLTDSQNNLFIKFIKNCPKISKITIGVKTDQLYNYMKNDDKWCQQLKSLVAENHTKILCRKYDTFDGNDNLIVLNCEPILQGLLTLDTEFIILNISKCVNERHLSYTTKSEELVSNQVSDNKIMNALNLMNFTSRLLLNPTLCNSSDGFIDQKSGHKSLAAIQTLTASTTFLKCMSFSFQVIILSKSPSIPEVDSENGCVFLSTNAIINKLKAEPQDWVRIWLSTSDNHVKPKSRLSQLFAIDSISNDNVVYISPQLWFNLQGLSSHGINQPLIQPNVTLMIRKEVLSDQIKYCPEIQISLIKSPEYSANTDFSSLLKIYFNKSRYLVTNDIIGIWSRDDLSFYNQSKELYQNDWPVIYFRVSHIDSTGCLIDSNHSNLYQISTSNCFIPVTLSSYYKTNVNQFEDNPNICGLENYIKKLCDITMPYLMSKQTRIGTIMIEGSIGSGKRSIVRAMCKHWNLHLYNININELLTESVSQLETKIKASLMKAVCYAPTVVLISNINILSNNELYDDSRITKTFIQTLLELKESVNEYPVILIATNSEPKKFVNNELNLIFTHFIEIECLKTDEREAIIRSLIGQIVTCNIEYKELAQKTTDFCLADLKTLISKALKYAYDSICDKTDDSDTISYALSGVVLTNDHLFKSLNELQKLQFDGSPNIPNVTWNDVGGHEHIKSEILDTIQLPIQCPQLSSLGFKRSGVLLYGPPGTGKTLLAKAAANQCSLNFLSVKGPELINMFVGQSEENVRNLFSRARRHAPAVIFFDELDSLAPNRGHSGDSGGVMDRVVSQLLAEMDGINKSNQVFVIGATNRVDLLDSALLRPGRFDRLLYVGLAEDSDSRLKILKALTRKFNFDSDVDLQQVESLCPPKMSGADMYSICSNALMSCIDRHIKQMNDNIDVNEDHCNLIVKMSDLLSALPKFSNYINQIKPN
ncbi:peroxisomal ATPase PEX6-like [Oppia nitens]|uniref:peroxisomal ATPase PEX6-like n=1 Tax=Oppia nitens TaxID=1686743 RepID=UPI0023DC9DDF|nr:peroxisomal ATPase PEX6-like [Oppia nitens]